ncbi:MAG: carboxypeptidase-like regulatory domain-containing protein [Pyrinomonadaceae bacterium]
MNQKIFFTLLIVPAICTIFASNAIAQICVDLGGSNPTSYTETFDNNQTNGSTGLTNSPAPQNSDASNIFVLNASAPRRYLGKFNNAVADSGATVNIPGFAIVEEGTNTGAVSGRYGTDNGTAAGGNTYTLGTTAGERSLGSLTADDINFNYLGACCRNTSSSPLTSVIVTFRGEQWRVGGSGNSDRLDFQYAINATNIYSGTYVDFNALDFASLVTTGAPRALDGNASGNNQLFTSTISGLNIPVNSNFYLRWRDSNIVGADDTLAVDNVGISFAPPTAASTDISGRVRTAQGQGIFKTVVTLTGSTGELRTVLTNPFGYYRFVEVPAGATYTVSVTSKGYRFVQNVMFINLTSELSDIDFIAQP